MSFEELTALCREANVEVRINNSMKSGLGIKGKPGPELLAKLQENREVLLEGLMEARRFDRWGQVPEELALVKYPQRYDKAAQRKVVGYCERQGPEVAKWVDSRAQEYSKVPKERAKACAAFDLVIWQHGRLKSDTRSLQEQEWLQWLDGITSCWNDWNGRNNQNS